jgi:hypothetical protein
MTTTNTRTVKSALGDYTSLSNWEAGRQADLVAGDLIEIAECYSMTDTTQCIILGWTTGVNNYPKIYTPTSERHDGKWNAAKYILDTGAAQNTGTIYVRQDYVRIDGIQIEVDCSGESSGIFWGAYEGPTGTRISNSIFRGVNGTNSGSYGIFNTVYGVSSPATIWNCLAYDFGGSGIVANHADSRIYNCTVIDCNTSNNGYRGGLGMDGNSAVVKNCLAKGNLIKDLYQGAGSDYNASGDASAAGAHSHTNHTFTFVLEASDDFHLASTDVGAIDLGVADPGSGLFSDDIDGVVRGATWDIGADEYVAAGGGSILPLVGFETLGGNANPMTG